MLGARSPFSSPWGFGITGSPSAGWTFTKTAQASTAETPIVAFGTSDGSGSLTVENASATDAVFSPRLRGVGQTTGVALNLTAQGVTDTGSNGVMQMVSRISTSTVVATRPMFEWLNHSTSILSLIPLNSGANSALSWGTQITGAPSLTTRSEGTRLVLRNEISGSRVDSAIGCNGIGPWYSCPEATSSWEHRWYGGTTAIMRLFGNGQLLTTAAPIVKLRVALTTPVTITTADHIVVSNLSSAGAVAVTLPSAPTTGTTYIIKDGKGDAGANNITITPAAGNIDGAGTLVLSSNYARCTLTYNGTEWNRID